MSSLRWFWDNIWDNRTWVFSGIGVLLLSVFGRSLINAFRTRSHRSSIHEQRATAGTSVMQAGRDINMNVGSKPHPPTLRVLAHRAYFDRNPMEHFFIKIVNITPDADVEVTHVWYQNGRRVDILSRVLPTRLRPSETWETFVPTASVPPDADAFRHFHALLSTGQVFASEHNKDVPPRGYVAGR